MFKLHRRLRPQRLGRRLRKGAILVLAAFTFIVILAFAAFTTDIGWISLTRAHLQNAADSAALSAAMELNPMADQATVAANVRQAVQDMAAVHPAGELDAVHIDSSADVQLGRRTYNSGAGTFTYSWGTQPYNCVRVTARRAQRDELVGGETQSVDRRLPLFFAPIIGHDKAEIATSAIATYQPRDIAVVLDFSSSMNDDSEYGRIDRLGLPAIQANLQQMWEDLGSPTYGDLPYAPGYATLSGQPASGAVPHIDVTYKGKEVYVKSTKDLSNVVLKYSNGATQKFEGLSGKTGTFKGTGGNSGKFVTTAWVKSGSNASGDGPGYGERFTFDTANLKKALGLDDVPYPYAGGSWDEYIYLVTYTGNYYQYVSNYSAGYHFKFGLENLVEYWTEYRPLNSETADLWKVRAQPITALKDATNVWLDAMDEMNSEDQVGLVVYTYPDETYATVEKSLSSDYAAIKDIVTHRQAGHYDHYTAIGAGIRKGRQELEENGRSNAVRMMVLMTDGLPNRTLTAADPRQFTLDEAQACKDAGIKITTISMGVDADRELMQEVADLTGGVHYNIPSGATIAEIEEGLEEALGEIAADRPLKLIYE